MYITEKILTVTDAQMLSCAVCLCMHTTVSGKELKAMGKYKSTGEAEIDEGRQ